MWVRGHKNSCNLSQNKKLKENIYHQLSRWLDIAFEREGPSHLYFINVIPEFRGLRILAQAVKLVMKQDLNSDTQAWDPRLFCVDQCYPVPDRDASPCQAWSTLRNYIIQISLIHRHQPPSQNTWANQVQPLPLFAALPRNGSAEMLLTQN